MPIDKAKIQRIDQYCDGLSKEFSERGNAPKYSLNTIPEFNRKIWGLKEGLTVIGARSSQGKSALSLQLAYDLASQGHIVYFLSLEMTVEALIERLFCNVMRVDNYELMTGQFLVDERINAKWKEFNIKIKSIPLLITCGIGKTFGEINELINLLDPKPNAVFVDYIQSVSTRAGQSREMLNEYIRYFRQLALQHKFVGVLCSQINRGAMENRNNEPIMSQLKETGVLEEHSDTIILLHWQNFYDHKDENFNEFKIIIAKQRNGRTGEYVVHYEPQHYRFTEVGGEPEIQTTFLEASEVSDKSLEIFGGKIV